MSKVTENGIGQTLARLFHIYASKAIDVPSGPYVDIVASHIGEIPSNYQGCLNGSRSVSVTKVFTWLEIWSGRNLPPIRVIYSPPEDPMLFVVSFSQRQITHVRVTPPSDHDPSWEKIKRGLRPSPPRIGDGNWDALMRGERVVLSAAQADLLRSACGRIKTKARLKLDFEVIEEVETDSPPAEQQLS